MKEIKRFGCFFNCLLIFLTCGLVIISVLIYCNHVKVDKLNKLYGQVNGKKNGVVSQQTEMKDTTVSDILSQTSIFIAICTGGIALFGIFGGVLSFVNIKKSQELEDNIKKTTTVLETQEELIAWRLIQEGRYYASKGKFKQAQNYFHEAAQRNTESFVNVLAEFERISLQADTFLQVKELWYLDNIIQQFEELENKLKKTEEYMLLKQEINFTKGCLHGDEALIKIEKNYKKNDFDEAIQKSIKCFDIARRIDGTDVYILSNAAVTYALAGKKDDCIETLNLAISIAKNEPLYKDLMAIDRVNARFKPYEDGISDELKKILADKFKIKF